MDTFTKEVCLETSILELWGFDKPEVFDTLTVDQILEQVNKVPPKR
jgi:hypothetical protein